MTEPTISPINIPFSSKCMDEKSLIRGEVRNVVISDMIGYMFDTYCSGGVPEYSGWDSVNEQVTTDGCSKGQKKLTINLLFRKDARIYCDTTQTEYVNDGQVMKPAPQVAAVSDEQAARDKVIADREIVINAARPYSTIYIYTIGRVSKGLSLPTDVNHQGNLLVAMMEQGSLDLLLAAFKRGGYSTSEAIDALKYISSRPGRFDGVASVLDDFLAILELKSDTSKLSIQERRYFIKNLLELPVTDSDGKRIPSFARYYYAYRNFTEQLGTVKRGILRRNN